MSELKKCPFCNGNRIEIRKNGLGWYIGCSDCLMGFSTLKNPKEYWNTRPIEDALLVRAEKAEAYIKKLEEKIPEINLALAQANLRVEKAEKELAALYKLYEDACLTISQNEYAYEVDRQVLESELAALREQTRWIPVSERLPEAGENNYLTLSPSGEVFIMCFNEFWYSPFDENGDESVISVTHWMPLPEPPEEGTRSPGNYRNWRKRMGVIQRDRQC